MKYVNQKAIYKEFQTGRTGIFLNKLYAKWTGPAEIMARCNPDFYKKKLINGNIKNVHVDKIRKFIPGVQAEGIIFEKKEELGEAHPTPTL